MASRASSRKLGPDRPLDRPADGEEALAVRSLDQLADGLAGRLERRVEVPARAGPAEVREGEVLAGIALGDVPGRVDAKHEEGHAARAGAAERRHPVRDLLDVGAELAAQAVDRVAMLLGGPQEAAVGHHDRAGGIIGEAHVQQRAGAGVGRPGDVRPCAAAAARAPAARADRRGRTCDSRPAAAPRS